MTTQHGPERPLSAEEELSVTRALRDLPAPPVPPALTARLDARLAELEEERACHPAGGRPSDAPAVVGRPDTGPRRRWPRLLVATAAVVVGGYAVGTAVDGSLTGGAGSSDSSA